MLTKITDSLSDWADRAGSDIQTYLKEHTELILALSVAVIAAYGFELFSLNITIDEEIFATYSEPIFAWLIQGRWGMYVLNRFLFPYTVLPFVPLFVALVFHMAAMLLLLEVWEVKSTPAQLVVGAIGLTFPTLAYMYTFSTLNFGIGIGFFSAALSLYFYARAPGIYKYLAVLPIAFSVAIYQGFIPVLVSIFLAYLLAKWIRTGQVELKSILPIALIHLLGFALYFLLQRLVTIIGDVRASTYIAGLFSSRFLLENFGVVAGRIGSLLAGVYFGDKSIHSIEIPALGLLMVIAAIGLLVNLLRSRLLPLNKILIALLAFVLLIVPFVGGFFMYGIMSMRFLIALPVTVAGFLMLGIGDNPRIIRFLMVLLAGFCIFKFTVAANHLFAASQLALEADRATASRLILRFEDALSESESMEKLKYMEVVGYLDRPPTELIPKAETFGASFFQIDQGSSMRLGYFLQTLGFPELEPLPLERRVQMIETANAMPVWPEKGSVAIVGDTLLIKFGPYSDIQKSAICALQGQSQVLVQDFCE